MSLNTIFLGGIAFSVGVWIGGYLLTKWVLE